MANANDIQWSWNAAKGKQGEWFRPDLKKSCWIYWPSGDEVPFDATEEESVDVCSTFAQVDEDENRPWNQWPQINTHGRMDNCAWVTLAALLADGSRFPTSRVFEIIKANNLELVEGPMNKDKLLEAARLFGEVEDEDVHGSYLRLRECGVPPKTNFSMGCNFDGGVGHRIVGYWDEPNYYRFTDWQKGDPGEDVTAKVRDVNSCRITYVFWYSSITGRA